MALKISRFWVAAGLALVLAGCGGDFSDLDRFMAEARNKPAGVIPPIPQFKAYKTFNYSAAGLRSPFQRPVEIEQLIRSGASSDVSPDPDRAREYLEQYSLDALALVGSVEIGGTLWGLVQDAEGGVHRVRVGNYMGRNHGRIVELTDDYVALVEIVPTGQDGWVERPRKLELRTSD